MTIVSSGAISINSLVGEYGGSAPHSMSEYYRGGGLVLDHSNNANVPTSGTIDLADFYGANNTSPAPTSYTYSMTTGQNSLLVTNNGFDSTAAVPFGSLGSNPQSAAFSSGFNPTWTAVSTLDLKGVTFSLIASTTMANSGWTNIVVPNGIINNGSDQTLTRASAGYVNTVRATWSWSVSWQFSPGYTGNLVINE